MPPVEAALVVTYLVSNSGLLSVHRPARYQQPCGFDNSNDYCMYLCSYTHVS